MVQSLINNLIGERNIINSDINNITKKSEINSVKDNKVRKMALKTVNHQF